MVERSTIYYVNNITLKNNKNQIIVLSCFSVILGIFTLGITSFPSFSSISFFGWILTFYALIQILQSFYFSSWRNHFVSLASGIIVLSIGPFIIINNSIDNYTFILLLSILFLFLGLLFIFYSMSVRLGKKSTFINGFSALWIGYKILSNYSFIHLQSIGLFLGIQLIINSIVLFINENISNTSGLSVDANKYAA